MSTILSRWRGRLATRRKLLDRAQRSVAYWTRRARSAHGAAMLREARARLALRKQQVAAAERIVQRHSTVTTVSPAGLAMIAGFEGFRSRPYQDAVGVWTIGYGETRGIGPHTKPWTRDYALRQLRTRVNRDYLAPVLATASIIHLELNQHQADALASLVYNVGPGILAPGHTMGNALRSHDHRRIADAFLPYDKAGSPPRALAGLTRRRRAERALYLRSTT
jgi:lysozyme